MDEIVKKDDSVKVEEKKMTLEEYEKSYNAKPRNAKVIKSISFIFAASIGIIIVTCLTTLVMKLFEIHKVAGYCGIGVSVLLLIFLYIIPLIKIKNTKAFVTTVNYTNAKEAKKYNKKMREDIADKMIDFSSKVENIGWYSTDSIGKIAVARHTKNDEALKEALTNLYNTDVKTVSNRLIRDHAIKVGVTTALSQSQALDTLFVATYDLNLIKELVFLYGYRPSEAELMKIYRTVINNSLISYGVNSVTTNLSTCVVNKLGNAISKNSIVGSLVGTAIESVTQGIINGSLTVVLGYQTKKYLKKEYKLQDILDNVVIEDDAESEMELINEVKAEIKRSKKKADNEDE